jgi:hypothetical protein
MLWTCIQQMLGSNLVWVTDYPDWDFFWFPAVSLGKCQDSTMIMPWILPSKYFPIHYSTIILQECDKDVISKCKLPLQMLAKLQFIIILYISILSHEFIYLYTYISISNVTHCLVQLFYHNMFRLYTAIIRCMSVLPKLFNCMLKLHITCEHNVNY